MFLVYVVLCLIVFGCQYQCNWLPGKTRLRMTYYVSSGTLNPTHSHSLTTYSTYKSVAVASILQCSSLSHVAKKNVYHCKNESRKLEVCGREICICIIVSASQQIPRLSRTFNLNFQDFPGGVGTLYIIVRPKASWVDLICRCHQHYHRHQ